MKYIDLLNAYFNSDEFAQTINDLYKTLQNFQFEEKKEVETRKEPSKEEQLVNFKLPKSKYEEYKKMLGAAGYSFSKGTRMILDYIYSEVQSGNIEIRESGIKQTLSARVGR